MKPSKWNTLCLLVAFVLFLAAALSAFTDVDWNEVGLTALAGALFVAAHHQFPPRG